MNNIKLISYKKALKENYISYEPDCGTDYNKCYFCDSHNLDTDNNQSVYREDIWGAPMPVEYGVVCKDCHQYQGYYAYGQVEPIYIKRKYKNKMR